MAKTAPDRRRVLLVEDEGDMAELLAFHLRENGYDVRAAGEAEAAIAALDAFKPELVLLDLMLPDASGFDVCRHIRSRGGDLRPGVIVLSARTAEIDRVVAFEIGADDYVTKPFSMRELLLRVRARLREVSSSAPAEPPASAMTRYVFGPLRIDLDLYRVTVDGREVPVSPLEMHLLRYLAVSQGAVCGREEMLARVWNYEPGTPSRTVDTHVKRLREKLGHAGRLIRTVRGKGYRLATLEDPRTSATSAANATSV